MKFESIDIEFDAEVSIIGIYGEDDGHEFEFVETFPVEIIDFLLRMQVMTTVSAADLSFHLLTNPSTFCEQYKKILETLFFPYLAVEDQPKIKFEEQYKYHLVKN